MEDFERRAREREKEINARKDIDPRDEKGLLKVEDHKHLGRDPKAMLLSIRIVLRTRHISKLVLSSARSVMKF